MLQVFLSFTEAEWGGKYDENQSVKFCAGRCDYRRCSLDNLFAAGLDDARSNDESDHKSVSYGDGQIRFVLSPLGVLWGLVGWSLFAGIFAWILATIYNLLARD